MENPNTSIPPDAEHLIELTDLQKTLLVQGPAPIRTSFPLPLSTTRESLQQAFDTLLRLHDALRCSLTFVDSLPYLYVHDSVSMLIREIAIENNEHLSSDSILEEYSRLSAETAGLDIPPLLRATLARQPRQCTLLLVCQHLIIDTVGLDLLREALFRLLRKQSEPGIGAPYESAEPISPLRVALRQSLQAAESGSAKAQVFWREQFRDAPFTTALRRDRDGEILPTVTFALPGEVNDAYTSIIRSHRVTPFMVHSAAVAITAAELANIDDVILQGTWANRDKYTAAQLACIAKQVFMRFRFHEGEGVEAILSRARHIVLGLMRYGNYPLERELRRLQLHASRHGARVVYPLGVAYSKGKYTFGESELSEWPVSDGWEQAGTEPVDYTIWDGETRPNAGGVRLLEGEGGRYLQFRGNLTRRQIASLGNRLGHVVISMARGAFCFAKAGPQLRQGAKVVSLHGANVDLHLLRDALRGLPGVEDASIDLYPCGEGLTGLRVSVRARNGVDEDQVRNYLAGSAPGSLVPMAVEVDGGGGGPDESRGTGEAGAKGGGEEVPGKAGDLEQLLREAVGKIMGGTVSLSEDLKNVIGFQYPAYLDVAVQMRRLGVGVELGQLVEARTIAELAGKLEAGIAGGTSGMVS